MSLTNYNAIEAANLSMGQGGFKSITNTAPHTASAEGITRWTAIMIVRSGGGSNIELKSNVGDDLTILNGVAIDDLVGTVISGDFHTVNAGGNHIMAFKG
jgi:hypothetical protein